MVIEMSVILDTSILIRRQRGEALIKKELESLSKRFPATPSVTFLNVFEYLMGIRLGTKREVEATEFLQNFNVLNTTERTPEIMVSLRSRYDGRGIAFSLADLIIASLAIENNMTLVTSDEDFKSIEELKLEFIH